MPYFESRRIVDDLGKVWHNDLIQIKAFPCCGANHTAIQALNRMLVENAIEPEDIEEIVVMGDPMMITPNRALEEIISYADTQFSNAYLTALVPYYGTRPGPAWQMPQTYNDPRVHAMMKKVKTVAHPRTAEILAPLLERGQFNDFRDVVVEVRAKGRRYTAEERFAKGSRGNPMSDAEIRAKFLDNASYSSLSTSKAEQAMEAVYELETVKDVSELTVLLRTE